VQVTAQQAFRDLEAGHPKPVYIIAGEEPFQAGEILRRLKKHFLGDTPDDPFRYEHWEGEGLDGAALRRSLDTLPGLFDAGTGSRLVCCARFDKASAGALEALEPYFRDPAPTTCVVLSCGKIDRRKAWFKLADEKGHVIEVDEPGDREWARWRPYLEARAGKPLSSQAAWEYLVDMGGRSLSGVWSELQKAVTFVGSRPAVALEDLQTLGGVTGAGDVFAFVEAVAQRKTREAARLLEGLLLAGESEIKLVSLLIRQFRLLDLCQRCLAEGVSDSKALAPRLGVHPFVAGKIRAQASLHGPGRVEAALRLLSECDYRLKTSRGSLFQEFLLGYFSVISRVG